MVSLLLAGALSGCSAANHTGVELDEDGVPVVVNCGTWIESVRASDAESGRTVWAAHARPSDSGIEGRARVELGVLPGPTWVEDSSVAFEPRPGAWRFTVQAVGESVEVVVSDVQLLSGRVFRPGDNRSESESHFDEQTCSGIPLSVMQVRVVIALGCAVVLVVIVTRRRQTKLATSP